MNEEKIKEVFSDEEFVKSFCATKTPEEAQAALAEKGIDVTVDELKTFVKLLQKRANGELTDKDLESVAGGSFLTMLCVVAGCGGTALGLIGGALIAWVTDD